MLIRLLSALALLVAAFLPTEGEAADGRIILASTTSTDQSGLFAHLMPRFTADTGLKVQVVAVGTGQALTLGRNGDADVLLVHDRDGEDKFVAGGHGIDRRDVMYNDFVVIGPGDDPASIAGSPSAVEAVRRIAAAKAPFVSRGDDSGTHRSERRLWDAAGVDLAARPDWYRELGSGMGATLNAAAGLGAYALSDRATWASFKNRHRLKILVEGDKLLFNPYGSILVASADHPAGSAAARVWHEWLTGDKGQSAIASFEIAGQRLFFPSASQKQQEP